MRLRWSAIIPVDMLIDFTEGLLRLEDLEWILSDVEVSGLKQVLISFTTDSELIPQVNLIFSYLPEVGLIEWLRLEVLVSQDVEASSFFTEYYPELIKSGGEVLVRSDGISIFYKVGDVSRFKSLRDYVGVVSNVLNTAVKELRYVSYGLVPAEGNP
ncbi:MAG: hypothetical protein QXP80_00345 [Zestosphaera sp.]